ncbi:MAG TPA: Maf family protein [Xanthobacteraceae bacterium]|nr:Maf family protein [Xanthobacteraceae bacterium]
MPPAGGLWRGAAPLQLASRSLARQDLLRGAGLPFELINASIDERALEQEARDAGAGPAEVARRLAGAKALAAAAPRGALVIGADQTLELDGTAFHKPADRTAARAQLQALAGRSHVLHAAVAVVRDGALLFETLAAARLTMRALDDAALDAYLDAAGAAVLGSVGAYQLEGLGIHLFTRIEGEHSVILGLPLLPLLAFLRREGLLL